MIIYAESPRETIDKQLETIRNFFKESFKWIIYKNK